MTNKREINIEIAKLQVKKAIIKLCQDRNLGTGSYDRIIIDLFFDGLPGYADLYDTNVSGFLRKMADDWDETEDYDIKEVSD